MCGTCKLSCHEQLTDPDQGVPAGYRRDGNGDVVGSVAHTPYLLAQQWCMYVCGGKMRTAVTLTTWYLCQTVCLHLVTWPDVAEVHTSKPSTHNDTCFCTR